MKVLQIIDSLSWGGAQKLLLTFAEAIHGQNIELTIISLSENNPTVSLHDDISNIGVFLVNLPAPHVYSLTRIVKLIYLIKNGKYDIIHTHLTYSNILGSLAGKITNTPVVSTLHTVNYDPIYDNHLLRKLETFFLRVCSSELIAVGYAVAQKQQSRFPWAKLNVIQNAVQEISLKTQDQRNEIWTREGINPNQSILISVGRLSRPKGYFDLIDAFNFVLEVVDHVCLVIVGGGKLFRDLHNRIIKRNLDKSVYLLGPRNDVPDLLAASDLFVSSSHWEGLPLVILEAMSAGLPIVATQVGEIPRVVVDGVGMLVPPHNPKLLAEAILTLLKNPQLMINYGLSARDQIQKNYGSKMWARKIISVYKSTLNSVTTNE